MSLPVDIAVTSGATATTLMIAGGAVYKLISHFLKRAIDEQLDAKLDTKLEPLKTSVNERFDVNDRVTKDAVQAVREVQAEQQSVKLNLATQFGGNGGGIRQAINELSVQIGTVKGAFEQHLAENRESK